MLLSFWSNVEEKSGWEVPNGQQAPRGKRGHNWASSLGAGSQIQIQIPIQIRKQIQIQIQIQIQVQIQIQIQRISGTYILCGEAMMASGAGQILEASCLQAEIVKKSEHSAYKTISKFP